MKIGDYVRTKDGTIGKIIAIDLAKSRQEQYPNHPSKSYWRDKILISCYKGWRTLQNVEKISHNIIDLIKIGDIITFKDDYVVYNVIALPNNEVGLDIFYLAKNYDGETEDISISKEQMEKYIKSIVTKEQFESMEYKVGEDNE